MHFANGHAPGLFRGGCLYALATAKLAINYEFNTMYRYVLRHIKAIYSLNHTNTDFPKCKIINMVASILDDMVIKMQNYPEGSLIPSTALGLV